MGLFSRNPLDAPWSTKRKSYLLLYLIFFAASVWASGESLARSTELPKTFCYIIAFGVLALASLCLKLVRDSFSRGYQPTRLVKLIFGILGFVIAWTAILSANTHNIYYVMTVEKQRQQELRNVKNQLELIQDKSVSTFKSAKTKYYNDIEKEIENLKGELLNRNNKGHGKEVDKILTRIEGKLGGNVDLPSLPPSDQPGLREYTADLSGKIREMAGRKLQTIDEKISQLNNFLQKEEYQTTRKSLDDLINNFDDTKSEKQITQTLINSYSTYNKAQEYINQLYAEPLIKDNADLSIEFLPRVPLTVESESIAFVWGQFLQGEIPSLSRFLWSIGIGFILDFTCFMFWYFGVLPEED